MGKYFGTDGFRGEANVNLTVDHAFKVGRFLGWYYGQRAKVTPQNPEGRCRVAIGKDTRRSSYMFEYALVAGLTASGANAYLLHVTTTPSVSYVVRTEEFDCGIMISASHNPYYDNGIKVINGRGEKLEENVIVEIERYLDGEIGEIPFAHKDGIGRAMDYSAGRNRYIGDLSGYSRARSDRDARIRFGQGGGVVDPVSDHHDLSSCVMLFSNKGCLVFRENFGIELVHSEPFRYSGGCFAAVAGHHDDARKTCVMQVFYNTHRFFADRVLYTDDCRKFSVKG